MAEATARASTTSAASRTLDAQTPTPIAKLAPELPDRDSCVIDGVVTITWPYSIVTRSAAFILAEHDFRLRHARGQLRIEFHGHAAQKLFDAGIGGGDVLRISLEGAEWETHKSQTRVPDTILEWQLKFTNRLLMRIQRADDPQLEILDLDQPNANGDDAPLATLTPQGSSPPMHSGLFATEVVATPGAHSPDYSRPAKRTASDAFEPAEYASPAFLKRARVSYGSLFEDGFDIFDEDVVKKKRKTKTKRTRFSMGATGWKYSTRSPSPEPRAPETHELESDSEEDNEAAEPVVAVMKSPAMVDESSQTQETSFASQVAEQARESASLMPSSPTPMTSGKPERKSNGLFAGPVFGTPSTTKEEAVSAFSQPARPLFGGTTNMFASATTITPSQSGQFGSSFGNSGFSVEHTTTASTSSIPVFNDALAESIQSREAAEERPPGQPESAFDVSAEETFHDIATSFDAMASQEAHQDMNPFAAPEFLQPASIRNPFAVEPFPQTALSSQDPAEDDIYEASTYPEIHDEDKPKGSRPHPFAVEPFPQANLPSHDQAEDDIYEDNAYPEIHDEDKPKKSSPHPFEVSRSFDRGKSDSPNQSARKEEIVEEQDESTDYDIEAGEPSPKPQQVESEEEEDQEDEDEGEDIEQEDYDEHGEGYDEEESRFNEHYEEDEEEHYDDDDEEEEDSDSETSKPASQVRQVSQDPVFISLLSDSEGEDEPAAKTPAPAAKTDVVESAESEESDESKEAPKTKFEGGDEKTLQQATRESDSRESSAEKETVQRSAEDEDDKDASADERREEASVVKEVADEEPAAATEADAVPAGAEVSPTVVAEAAAKEEHAVPADTGADTEVSPTEVTEGAVRGEHTVPTDPEVPPTEVAEASEEEREAAEDMDIDEDDDQVQLISIAETERPFEEMASPAPSPIAVDEDADIVDAMEEDDVSEPALPEASHLSGKADDAMDEDQTSEPAQPEVNDINEKANGIEEDVEVADAPEAVEDEIKSQPDIDMEVKEPEEIEMLTQGSPEVMVDDGPPEQIEQEPEVNLISEAPESFIQDIEEVTEVDIKDVPAPDEPVPVEDEPVPVEDEPVPAPDEPVHVEDEPVLVENEPAPVENELSEEDAKQLLAEAEVAAITQPTARSTRNRQLPTPIDTQLPVAEAEDIELVHTAQDQPQQDAEEDEGEDDEAATQQIMAEFLQHASPQQNLSPPPPPASAKEHRRKRSDTISETGRRTRSQTKQHADQENEPAAPMSSPHSHRRGSRSIDKSNDTAVVPSIEPNTSMMSNDRTPLLQRSFRVTRSRGAADQADPSVAIAKATRGAASPASPRLAEHTPSRPIMLRVTRSMESIAEAGVKEGLVMPEASIRSTRRDDASSFGTHSPAGSTPLTPSTQLQMQLHQEQHHASASPAIVAPPIPDPSTPTAAVASSALKMQLQRDLRTTLPDALPLRSLRNSLGKTTDVVAVAAATPAAPYRHRNRPRDYMLELLLVDPSSAPLGVTVAHLFRPFQQALPVVRQGDVVLLRAVEVVAVKGRGFGLRAGDASAWAVFDEQARDGDAAAPVLLPQIKGPPVELSEAEIRYAAGLARWWAALDEDSMNKTGRAAQRMVALS